MGDELVKLVKLADVWIQYAAFPDLPGSKLKLSWTLE